jgi:FkbM family methyltransferase
MSTLYGPRMYYSLFGIRGLVVGARARIFSVPLTIAVAVPGIAHPVHLRVRTTDVALFREIFLHGIYEANFCEEPQVVVDAGANIGLSSVFYANKFPNARIVAVEPEPSNYEMLQKNTAPYPNVIAVHAALWKENCNLSVYDPGTGNTTFRTQPSAGKNTPVVGVTLDKLMMDYGIDRIDLLKMDIEGAESDVFEHPSQWIDRVGAIAVEVHDWIHSGSSAIVRSATRDFPFQWQDRETDYFSRRRPVNGAAADAPRIRLRILSVC